MTQDLSQVRHGIAAARALTTFYNTLAAEFPEATTGDADPIATATFTKAAEAFVAHWVEMNIPFVLEETWIEDAALRARVRPARYSTFYVEFAQTDDHGGVIGGWSIAEDGAIRSDGFETADAALAYMAMVKAGADLYSAVEIIKKMCIPREPNE